jgi:hypothetical protein
MVSGLWHVEVLMVDANISEENAVYIFRVEVGF